jgi:hypothetical protein
MKYYDSPTLQGNSAAIILAKFKAEPDIALIVSRQLLEAVS